MLKEKLSIPTEINLDNHQILILGLDTKLSYTIEEIKKAFRVQSKIHHPDAGGASESFFLLCECFNVALQKIVPVNRPEILNEAELKYCRRMSLDLSQIRVRSGPPKKGERIFYEPPEFVFNPPPIRDAEFIKLLWEATIKIGRHNNKIFVSTERYRGKIGGGNEVFDNKEFRLGAETLFNYFGGEDFVANFVVGSKEKGNKHSHQIAIQCETKINSYTNIDPVQAIYEKRECKAVYVGESYYSATFFNRKRNLIRLFKIIPDYDPINSQTIQIIASKKEEKIFTSHREYEEDPEIDLFKNWYILLIRLVDQNLLSKTKTITQSKPLKIIFSDRIDTYYY
jgi:hypothetical protein